ncbi:unnamed protein product [Withania somnifera]
MQYPSVKPLSDRVLVKIKTTEEKTVGGILLPTMAQSSPQGGEIVAVGRATCTQVLYSKYLGTEVQFDGSKHLILKEDDTVGILDTDDVKDTQPFNDRVLIKAEEKNAGGLILSEASKEKPRLEGNRKPLSVSPGNTVLYSKYAVNDFKGADGSDYITLKATDVMAVLS